MIVLGSNSPSGKYQIANSVRLRSSASASLTRTNASGGSTQIITFSFWVKRGTISSGQYLTTASQSSVANDYIRFESDDTFSVCLNNASTAPTITSSAVYRDPSAWYHIVVAIDTTQATDTNRMKAYVNGVQITSFSSATYPAQNFNMRGFNSSSILQYIGAFRTGVDYFDGYITEAYFIDGQALTPTSFGAFDVVTGVWNPKQYSGTYGTNGFYLKFNDTSNFGKDSSGNSNTWTSNNISNTAGSTYDSMVDTPTNYGSDTGVGGEVRGNYAVWNKLDSWGTVMSDGNLSFYDGGSNAYFSMPCFGKVYFEVACNNLTGGGQMGFCVNHTINTQGAAYSQSGYYGVNYASGSTSYWINAVSDGINHGTITNNTLKFAVDSSTGKVWIGSGSTWFNSGDPVAGTNPAFTLTVSSGDLIYPIGTSASGSYIMTMNAGQRPFLNTAPSGFKAMCTQNMGTPAIAKGNKYFDVNLYTGSASTQSITNSAGFQPDLVWIKDRSSAQDHKLTDALRGTTKALVSDSTAAETTDANGVTAFNSNGFSIGTGTRSYSDSNADSYVAWQWKGNGSGVSNTNGSITSTVNANTTAGISVVSFTGTSGNATVGHGLGVAPAMVILKSRNSATSWGTYHTGVGNTAAIFLSGSGGQNTSSTFFQNTSPTSTVFSIGTDSSVNASQPMIAYCFAPISGFSAFGKFTGNGSADGPFVYCGFRPRYLLIKRFDTSADWFIWDSARDTYNYAFHEIYAEVPNAEVATVTRVNFVSNGFKMTSTNSDSNGGTVAYAAFAENPFTISRAR